MQQSNGSDDWNLMSSVEEILLALPFEFAKKKID
jgi:hypothetical protein